MVSKKLLVLLMIACLGALLVGCGGDKAINEDITNIEPPPVDDTPPQVEDEPVVEEDPRGEDISGSLKDVFFDFDKYSLSSSMKQILESNASALKRSGDTRIVLEGHCDERGTKSYNLALGEKRANAAKDYLVRLGVSGSRITVISYGKERPFAMGSNESAWAKNRRAHVVIK